MLETSKTRGAHVLLYECVLPSKGTNPLIGAIKIHGKFSLMLRRTLVRIHIEMQMLLIFVSLLLVDCTRLLLLQ